MIGQEADNSERFIRHLEPLQGALEAFCRHRLHDKSLIEDVLQDAVGKAFRDFDLFAEGTNFRAWIFKYVHFCILEMNRLSRTRRHELLNNEPAVEDGWELDFDDSLLKLLLESPEVVLEQCDDDLNQAVGQLRPLDRSVLLLKAIGGFKYREIAEIVAVPMGTVMSSLARARQRVRHELINKGREQGCFCRHEKRQKASSERMDCPD